MISRHTRKKHTAAGILALLLVGAACDDSQMAPQEPAAETLAFSPDAGYVVTHNVFWPGQRQPDPWLHALELYYVKFETVEAFDLFLRSEIEVNNVNKEEGYIKKTIQRAYPSMGGLQADGTHIVAFPSMHEQAHIYTYFDVLHNVTPRGAALYALVNKMKLEGPTEWN